MDLHSVKLSHSRPYVLSTIKTRVNDGINLRVDSVRVADVDVKSFIKRVSCQINSEKVE